MIACCLFVTGQRARACSRRTRSPHSQRAPADGLDGAHPGVARQGRSWSFAAGECLETGSILLRTQTRIAPCGEFFLTTIVGCGLRATRQRTRFWGASETCRWYPIGHLARVLLVAVRGGRKQVSTWIQPDPSMMRSDQSHEGGCIYLQLSELKGGQSRFRRSCSMQVLT